MSEQKQAWQIRVCPRHYFPHRSDGYVFGEPITCDQCHIEFLPVEIGHYIRGYMAAGGNPVDVMPDWRPIESLEGFSGVVP